MRPPFTPFERYNILSNFWGVGSRRPKVVFIEYEYKTDLSPTGTMDEYSRSLDRQLNRWKRSVSVYWINKKPTADWFSKNSPSIDLESFIAFHLSNLFERMEVTEFKEKHFLYDESILYLYPMVIGHNSETNDILYKAFGMQNTSYSFKDLWFIQRLLGLSGLIKSYQTPVDKPLICLIGKEFWQNSDKWELTKQFLFATTAFSNIVDGKLQKCYSDDYSVLCFEEPSDSNFIQNKELTSVIECLTGDLDRFQPRNARGQS